MKTILLIFIQLLLLETGYSQGLHTTRPEDVGLSSDRLNRIKTLMQKYVAQNKLPGLLTMVARNGNIVHFEKYGMMDTDKPMELNAIFRIASMSKPITSVAVMMLYEEGYFHLDDPVYKYIPEFRNLKVITSIDKDGIHVVNQIKPMTIRNLLTHTSGLTYGIFGNTPVDSIYRASKISDGTLKNMVEKLSQIPLLYQPGTKWNYSVSTDVLGYLVEVVSGKPFNQFVKERIFIPLKMKDTDFFVPVEKINRCAAVYGLSENKVGIKVIIKPDTAKVSKPAKLPSGGGGLFSTAADYMTFAQMLLNKGEINGVRILGRKTVEFMTENHLDNELLPINGQPGIGFGLGFSVVLDYPKTQMPGSNGEYGWSGLYGTYFSIDPKEKLIFILMTQFSPYNYAISKEFNVLVYQSIVDH